ALSSFSPRRPPCSPLFPYTTLFRSGYPAALRRTAPGRWRATATATLAYAAANHAPHGRLTEVAGAVATAALHTGHAVLAERGEWVTNEKQLLTRAGLRDVDTVIAGMRPCPESLTAAVAAAGDLFAAP